MEVHRRFWVLLLLVQLARFATGNGIRDPKYSIEFHNLDEAYVPEDPDMEEMVSMTGKNGSKFECFVPKLERNVKNNGTSNTTPVAEIQDFRKSPEEILQILNGNCFHRLEGWWTYEFCLPPAGRIRQLHFEGNKKIEETQEFVLGLYDAEASARLHESSPVLVQKDPRSQSAAQKYYAQVYTNGTSCDLTNEPRETEVRFVCSEVGQPGISSIKEAPSCKYTLIFQAPMLCKHPLFHEERQPWLTIHCNGPPTEAATMDDDGENVEKVESRTLVPVLETETEPETEEAKA